MFFYWTGFSSRSFLWGSNTFNCRRASTFWTRSWPFWMSSCRCWTANRTTRCLWPTWICLWSTGCCCSPAAASIKRWPAVPLRRRKNRRSKQPPGTNAGISCKVNKPEIFNLQRAEHFDWMNTIGIDLELNWIESRRHTKVNDNKFDLLKVKHCWTATARPIANWRTAVAQQHPESTGASCRRSWCSSRTTACRGPAEVSSAMAVIKPNLFWRFPSRKVISSDAVNSNVTD